MKTAEAVASSAKETTPDPSDTPPQNIFPGPSESPLSSSVSSPTPSHATMLQAAKDDPALLKLLISLANAGTPAPNGSSLQHAMAMVSGHAAEPPPPPDAMDADRAAASEQEAARPPPPEAMDSDQTADHSPPPEAPPVGTWDE
jgi:hypothetical protein